MTNHSLRQVLQKSKTLGRLVKWVIKLREFDIHFKSRTMMKGQAAADFIAQFIPPEGTKSDNTAEATEPAPVWDIYVDDSANKTSSGAGIITTDPERNEYPYTLRFNFETSNNIVEYEALIGGIQLCLEFEATRIRIFSDSQLVVNQVDGSYQSHHPRLISYQNLAGSLLQKFDFFEIKQRSCWFADVYFSTALPFSPTSPWTYAS
ncbi:uncharacterized protein LOC126803464 [Argentina anserina]|uniref:uncharacterized protein LOC126803464 n=1 Tax=Argentina anserina TaxID=57926 RepID=UPI0021764753|nr:uncharacterized protein LOC126803464 [Potentilla anserina]